MLSGHQFAEDELFSVVAFDRISLRNMYIHNHIRCQRFPHLERRRQGCLPWRPAQDSVAQSFLKTVETGIRSVWGSNAERSQCRPKAFAYQTRFGQPALFVTLTPNTDNSLVLSQYAGISSVDTLLDILEARLPSKAALREASRRNDCASACLFMRQVDAFIRYALGIKKSLPFRGLFGDVKV
ncbi:hypothetical protein JG688_00010362 [Phytophthora aleatoria]|uniref:Helitron helicase-like domain-containing protein n=1 Tax=Phytophthora aleatoria TaxID=2496075 RepID=A0A8J5MF49_9STRA|nr:hypothetical protein JG688_00010362 [Phytophthora aleatoria]